MATKRAVVEETLRGIHEREGELLPERLVELAKATRHPLHRYFEWDDKVAGHQHRLAQAREMIREVHVTVLTADESYKVRVFFPQRYLGRERGGYIASDDITAQERPLLLRRMRADYLALKAKYQHLAEFWSMVQSDGNGEEVEAG